MPKISEAEINSVRMKEQGADPSTPSSGYGQIYIKTDGVYFIGDGGSATGPFIKREDYVLVRDKKAQNTNGGTHTQGDWRTRDLNEEVVDTGNICTLSSNQVTLPAGTYRCHIVVPSWNSSGGRMAARLRNVTSSATLITGTAAYAGGLTVYIFIDGRFTLSVSTTLEVQHYTDTTQADTGFGLACNITDEIYTTAEFWKEA
jgi:hypothetical protein